LADAQSKRLATKLHIGTMGWSYSFWKGGFYPKDLPSKGFLNYYAKHMNSVEVDSTFYRIPTEKTIIEWKKQTPPDFKFSLKFPAKITHIKMLRDSQVETSVFLGRVGLLEEKIGVLLLQFPPTFGQQHLTLLEDYLKSLPKGHRYAVEVRNRLLLNGQVYALLRESNVALAWIDSIKMPLAEEATADFGYLRWEGNRKTVTGTLGKTETDRSESIQAWAEKLKALMSNGTEVFGYFSKYYSGFPPSDAAKLVREMQLMISLLIRNMSVKEKSLYALRLLQLQAGPVQRSP
jgi:uncharacterized protein YecE (DUF72 family)